MSVAELQKRLGDLKFSLEETVKALHQEANDFEDEHAAWEEEPEDSRGDEPEESSHIEEHINALESARDKIDEAIEALDAALED